MGALQGFVPREENVPLAGFKPVSGTGGEFKPRMSTYIPDTDPRVRKHGGIKAEPEKSFLSKVGSFAAHLVPFHQYMTEEGRRLQASWPEEAQAQQNFMEFTKLLDWTIGGPNAIAFVGKKLLKQGEKALAGDILEKVLTKGEDRILKAQTKNQKHINELFDDLTHPADLTQAQRNQKIIEQTFEDNSKNVLPVKHAQPPDRVKALQEANQKIINATDIAFKQRRLGVPTSSQQQAQTGELLETASGSVRVKGEPRSGTSELLRRAGRSQRRSPWQWEKTAEDMLDDQDIVYFHSGLPLKEGVENAKNLIKETIGKFWWKPKVAQDLKLREQIIGIPQWLAKKHPQIKRLYNIEMARSDARGELQHQFLEGLDPFFKLKGQDYEAVKRLLLLGDKDGRVFTKPELAKAGLSQRGIDGYESVRSTLDSAQSHYWAKMKEMGVPEDELLALRKQIGSIEGYFPRVRQGKYFIRAEKAGEPSRRVQFNSGFKGKQLRTQLEQEGFKVVESGKVTKLPEEVYHQISPEAISQVVNVASRNFDVIIQKELKQNVANAFKQRGWGQHGITRQDFIEGFETENLKKVLYDYVNGFSGYVTKMDAAKQFQKNLVDMAFDKSKKGVSAAELPRMYKWGEDYVKHVMSNTDMVDKISSGIRAASFYKYLGAVIKTSFVNASQNAVAAAPRLSLETKGAYPKLGKAMGDIVAHYAPKGRRLLAEEQKALRIALQKRWGQEQYVKELMGNLGKYGRVPGAVQKIMGGPMAIAERFNRQSTFLAAFRVFRKEKGLAFDDALRKAGEIVEDSHFTYGKSNLPSLFRGSTAGKLARSAYTFRTFPHQYINLLSHLNRTDKKAVAKALGSIVAVGGASSIPLAKTFESVAQRLGYQPRQYLQDKIKEYGLEFMGDEIIFGLPALLDIDLSGSIGMEMPGQHQISSDDPRAMILEGAVDVLGVPFSYVDDTIKSTEYLYNGDVYRALENSPVTPTVISNAMQAKRIATEGQTTRSGKAVLTDEGVQAKYTTPQAIKKGVFGFQSVEASKEYQKFRSRQAAQKHWDRQKSTLLTKYRTMLNRHGFGSKQADSVMGEIEKYNASVPVYGSPITAETLMERLADKMTRKELLLRQTIQ